MNTADDIRRAIDIFDKVCDLPSAERSAALDRLCEGDATMRGRVAGMLATEEDDHAALTESQQGAGAKIVAHELDALQISRTPERIERYTIVRELGRGGMGIVYEAEQDNPRRRVALKVIRQPFASSDLVNRFRQESHVLGQLRHPGIAQIIEAGTTPIGENDLPYFTMELIEGVPLDTYARALKRDECVELMARVCDAVQHAHQCGIIHRDLKPANIHVVPASPGTLKRRRHDPVGQSVGALGQPKIMDFGIARLLDADIQVTTFQTDVGQIVGTLEYMSPEQVAGNSAELGTRCDVYALGVILYHLLADRLPLEVRGKSLAEAARIIRDVDPERLAAVNSTLRGDLDTIVSTAIEKDPDRRYASVAALADDLRRHLAREPISAHPPSTFYQLRKFSVRNKALVGGVAMTLCTLTLGLVVSGVLLFSITRERNARQSALEMSERDRIAKKAALDASQEVTAFFTDMLANASPESLGKDVTVRQLLDLAGHDIGARFTDRPLLAAKIRVTIGATYISLSEYTLAQEQLVQALQIYEAAPKADASDILAARLIMARLRFFQQDYETAMRAYDKALATLRDNPTIQVAMGQIVADRAMAALRLGEMDDALHGFHEAIGLLTAAQGEGADGVLAAKSNLAELYSRSGAGQATAFYEELVEESQRIRGADHPDTLLLLGNLATHLMRQNQHAEAIPLLHTVHQGQVYVLGQSHRQTLITVNNLAICLSMVKRIDEAQVLLDQAIALSTTERGEIASTTLFLTYGLGVILRKAGRIEEAERVLLRAAAMHRRVQGPVAEGTWNSERELLILYSTNGRTEQAVALGEAMLQRLSHAMPEGHPWYVEVRYYLATTHLEANHYHEAERLFLAASKDANQVWLPAIQRKLAKLHEASGRSKESDHCR